MRIVVIGGTGTIGKALVAALSGDHEMIPVSRTSVSSVDLGEPASIASMLGSISGIDAVVCCAANVDLMSLGTLTDEDLARALRYKLLGQVNLVRQALGALDDGGSITLTGGTFARPMSGSAIGALVNAGLEGFVRSAAPEMPRGLRLNIVSPG